MSDLKVLSVQKRTETGKGPNRRLRAAGLVTGVYYDATGKTMPVQLPHLPMEKMAMFAGRTIVFNLEVDDNGKKEMHPVLIWDLDRHPFKNRIDHVDFYGVDLEKELEVRVPLEFSGTAKGTKVGGTLEIMREHMEVFSKPLSLPSKIQIDVTDLDLNQHIRVGDLKLAEGVRPKLGKDVIIVSVITKAEEAEEEASK